MKMKKLCAFMLALMMIAGVLPMALADDAAPQTDFTNNLALGKNAVASNVDSASWAATKATDGIIGDTTNRWSTKSGTTDNWIYVDLETPTEVSVLRFYEFQQRIQDFVVEYSDNASDWTIVATETGLTSGSTTHRDAYTVEFTPTTAQYWRLRETACSSNITLFEIELYGLAERLYESMVLVEGETWGSVQQTSDAGYAAGAEVILTAQPTAAGEFVEWRLPEGLALTEGSTTTATIKYNQPQENITITAVFQEKQQSQTGDVLDDEMGYADINAVPWGADWRTTRISAPEDYEGTWPDTTEPKVGAVEVNDGKIRISRTGTLSSSDTVVATRILSDHAQPANDMTLEYEYVKESAVKVYVGIASPTDWRGPLALVQNADGTFSAAGVGTSLSGGNSITATGTVKVTIHLHKQESNADIYINDQLLKAGYAYDTRYSGYYDAGKLGFTLQDGTELNQGITINYVRYMETSEYAKYAMAKDADSVDVSGLPQDGASITESIALPALPETFPYGSTGVWESSDESVLNAQTGAVTRGESDRQVTLSLKLSKLNEAGKYSTEETPSLSFTFTVTGTKADQNTPGTLPVSLEGDVLDDEMGYADINAVPWGYWKNGAVGDGESAPAPYLFMYTTGGVNQPAGFTGETWYDDESKTTKSGEVSVTDGNLRLVRTAASGAGDTISLNKFLLTEAQPSDQMTLEFEYEKDSGTKVQIGIQSPGNWRGAIAFTHNGEGAFEGVSGSTGITSTGTTKITMHLDKAAKTADIYVNDSLLKAGFAYDSRYAGYYDAGKLGFTILKDSEQNKGLTLHYIRYMETAEYANIALTKDKTQANVAGLPESGATLEDNLTMPEMVQLPYGSIPYLESSDNSVLDVETGVITKRLEEQTVTLSLKLKKLNENGEYISLDSALQQWTYTVAKSSASLQDDVDALGIEKLLGENAAADQITTSLVLPSAGQYAGSDITWRMEPADAPIDLATGAVTRPIYGDDIPVTLTATFTSGGQTITKDFDIVILTNILPNYSSNLALNKNATASSVYASNYGASLVTDGDTTTTRWASRGSNGWVMIDLEVPEEVTVLRFYEFAQRISAFVVEYSNDASNWSVAATETGLPTGATTNRAAYTVEFEAATARYWRLRQTAGSADITIFEVELYGPGERQYESAVSVSDETLGNVQQTGGPGYALGAEVTLTAQPATTGKFIGWQLPEALALTEGDVTTPTIKYHQPQKNIKLEAQFAEKDPASIDVKNAVYDKYENAENHGDVVVTLTPGDYVFQGLRCGRDTLEEGTHYQKEGTVITLLQSWLNTLSGEQSIIFLMDGGDQPSLTLEIKDSDPATLIQEDLAAITKPEYQLTSGMAIPAVGPLHGSNITVTSSNTNAVQVVQETQDGQLVNKLVVTATQSANVTLTISGTLSGITVSLPEIRCAVAGQSSSGSGGSGGSGSGGGSSSSGGGGTSRPSGGSVINYGTGTTATVPTQPSESENTQTGRFRDVNQTSWAYEYIELLANIGVVAGNAQGDFEPDRDVTREEFVKMVVSALEMETEVTIELPFVDVTSDDWSYPYIAAAYQAGIINGTSETVFGVGETISRQDMAVITARALDAAQVKILPVTEIIRFTDEAEAADYAAESIDRIARSGVVGGYPDGSFRPQDSITRAETAKVLAQVVRMKEE